MIGLFPSFLKTAPTFEQVFKVCVKFIFCYLTNKNCKDAYFELTKRIFNIKKKTITLTMV